MQKVFSAKNIKEIKAIAHNLSNETLKKELYYLQSNKTKNLEKHLITLFYNLNIFFNIPRFLNALKY